MNYYTISEEQLVQICEKYCKFPCCCNQQEELDAICENCITNKLIEADKMQLETFMLKLKDAKTILTTQEYKTLKGQALAGNSAAAYIGLQKLILRKQMLKELQN